MSYKDLAYTYGTKTLKQINDLTGMSEGDTVFNSDWGIIEIYSGTNWTNHQSIEMFYVQRNTSSTNKGRLSAMPPIPSYADVYQRVQCPPISGTNNDEQNGYIVMQSTSLSSDDFPSEEGFVNNAEAVDDQNRLIGATIRGGTATTENPIRIVIAFMGVWNAFVAPNTNSTGTSLTVTQGFFTKISSNYEQSGMLDDSVASSINTGNFGPTMNGKVLPAWPFSASTPPDRNIIVQIQHMEVA